MTESYPFSSQLLPYGPSSAICSSLRHSSPYLIRFAPLRIHGLNRTFAWCDSVKMAMSKDMRANMQQHGRILPFFVRIAPIWPQHRHMQQPAAFQPLSYQICASAEHGLNRTFAWCASVKMVSSRNMRANMQQHDRILPFFVTIAPIWPQHRHMQQPAAF